MPIMTGASVLPCCRCSGQPAPCLQPAHRAAAHWTHVAAVRALDCYFSFSEVPSAQSASWEAARFVLRSLLSISNSGTTLSLFYFHFFFIYVLVLPACSNCAIPPGPHTLLDRSSRSVLVWLASTVTPLLLAMIQCQSPQ